MKKVGGPPLVEEKLRLKLSRAAKTPLYFVEGEDRYVGGILSAFARPFNLHFSLNEKENLFFGVQHVWDGLLTTEQIALLEKTAAEVVALGERRGTLKCDTSAYGLFHMALAIEIQNPLVPPWSHYRALIREFAEGLDIIVSQCEVAVARNRTLNPDQMIVFFEAEMNGAVH